MAVTNGSSRTAGIAGGFLVAFLLLAYLGVQYILSQAWGLVFEVTYVLILLIVFAILADRVFIR